MKRFIAVIICVGVVAAGCEKKEEKAETVKKAEQPNKTEAKTEKTLRINGESIFRSKGCSSCHQPEVDYVGPSLKKISSAYKGNKKALLDFLKGNGKPVVDPSKFSIMAPQLNVTKQMSPEDINKLADFILKH
ncbi:c-type cytochrome [Persephonella sp.]